MENNNVQDLHHEEGEGNHPNPSFIPFSSLDELPMDEGETTELVWRNGQVMVQRYSNVRNQAANAAAGEIPAAVAEEVEVSPEHLFLAEEEMAWFQHQNEGSFLDCGFYDGDVVDPAPPAVTIEAVETTVVAPLSVEEVTQDAQSSYAAASGGSPASGRETAAPGRETSGSLSSGSSASSFSASAEHMPIESKLGYVTASAGGGRKAESERNRRRRSLKWYHPWGMPCTQVCSHT